MNAALLKKIDWQYLVNRRGETLLFRSLTENSYRYFHEVTDIKWRASVTMRLATGEVYYSGRELNQLRQYFVAGGPKALSNFQQKLVSQVKSLDQLARKFSRVNWTPVSQEELIVSAEQFFDTARRTHNFLLPMPVADGVLTQMILAALPVATPEQKQAWLRTLAYPSKENSHTEELRAFYRLASMQRKKDADVEELLRQHVKTFSWIGTRGYAWDRAWTTEDVSHRLRHFREEKKNPKKELEQLEILRTEHVQAVSHLLSELSVRRGSTLWRSVRLAQEFAYLRTWRTDTLYRSGYLVHDLFSEIARRAGFDPSFIPHLTFREILSVARRHKLPVSQEEMARRLTHSYATLFHRGRYSVFSEERDKQALRKAIARTSLGETKVLKGNAAFKGKARGRARLVLTASDIGKVERGDILVAVMTFPHFIAAMERAAAFVTDEGGILCHAAIVAREMRKPCVIATGSATQTIKDGDMVEVDGEKGEVRLLKRWQAWPIRVKRMLSKNE